MARQSVTVRAAWIAGAFMVVAALISWLALYFTSDTHPTVSANSAGNSSSAIAIGGNVSGSSIVVNANASKTKGLSDDGRTIVDQIIGELNAAPASSLLPAEDRVESDASQRLKRDPYDVRALLMRGQWRYTRTRAGGVGMDGALSDFERAAEADKELADPHFGIGTVLYELAVFDLAQRGRYKIHERGAWRINKDTKLLEMRYPTFELYPDRRAQTVLDAALEEFQIGQALRQEFDAREGTTVIFYAPQDVEKRVRSIRYLLGYEPQTRPDDELVLVFIPVSSEIFSQESSATG